MSDKIRETRSVGFGLLCRRVRILRKVARVLNRLAARSWQKEVGAFWALRLFPGAQPSSVRGISRAKTAAAKIDPPKDARGCLARLRWASHRKTCQALTRLATFYNDGVYLGFFARLQARQRRKLEDALLGLRRHSRQIAASRRARLAAARTAFQTLSGLIEHRAPRKRAVFAALRSNVRSKTSNYISRIMYLLSQKFKKKVDERFLNEQIRYMILKNKIHQKSVIAFVKESEIDIDIDDYNSENKINNLESLIKVYRTIELFSPLDFHFFKRRQTCNRFFMRALHAHIRERARTQRRLRLETGLAALAAKVEARQRAGWTAVKRVRRKSYANFAVVLNLVLKHVADSNRRLAFSALRLFKHKDRKTWIFFVLHNRFQFSKKYYFLLLRLVSFGGDFPLEMLGRAEQQERGSALSSSMRSQSRIVHAGEEPLLYRPRLAAENEKENVETREAFALLRRGSKPSAFSPQKQAELLPFPRLQGQQETSVADSQGSRGKQPPLQSGSGHASLLVPFRPNHEETAKPRTHHASLYSQQARPRLDDPDASEKRRQRAAQMKAGLLFLQNYLAESRRLGQRLGLGALAEHWSQQRRRVVQPAKQSSQFLGLSSVIKTLTIPPEGIDDPVGRKFSLLPALAHQVRTADLKTLKTALRALSSFTQRREYGLMNRAFASLRALEVNYEIIEIEDLTNTLEPVSIVMPQQPSYSGLDSAPQVNRSMNRAEPRHPQEMSVVHRSTHVPREAQLSRFENVLKPSVIRLAQKEVSGLHEPHRSFNFVRNSRAFRNAPSDNWTETKESMLLGPSQYNYLMPPEPPGFGRGQLRQGQGDVVQRGIRTHKSEKKIPTPTSIPRVLQSYKFK